MSIVARLLLDIKYALSEKISFYIQYKTSNNHHVKFSLLKLQPYFCRYVNVKIYNTVSL
jgi:hypothetical protein